jgi:hypothetical protein
MQVSSCSNVNFKSIFVFPKKGTIVGIFSEETAKEIASTYPYVRNKGEWNVKNKGERNNIFIDSGYANWGGNTNDIPVFNMILKRFFGKTDFVTTVSQIAKIAKDLGIEYLPSKPNKVPLHDFHGRMGHDGLFMPERQDNKYFKPNRDFKP